MTRLLERSPVWHAVLWILAYVLTVNVGDVLSARVGVPNVVTAPLLVLLSLGLLLYVRGRRRSEYYGLVLPDAGATRRAWYFLPLLAMASVPVALGLWAGLDLRAVALVVLLMLGVGFLEEVLFRGFLFRAILDSGGLVRAVIVSGVTFGVGHVVNLLRGYTGGEQLVQIGIGIGLGILLALLFAVTGSILPGVVFHAALNIGGTVTERGLTGDVLAMAIMLGVSALFAVQLLPHVRGGRAARRGGGGALPAGGA